MMIPEAWKETGEKLKGLAGSLPAYTALGSFLLYVAGYLVLRFQLSLWGVVSDLPALDERYMFAGARFTVYLVASVCSAILLSLPLAGLCWLGRRWLRRLVPTDGRHVVLLGILFAVSMVQFVMRQCFLLLDGVLLGKELPDPSWLKAILLEEGRDLESLYFTCLVAAVGVTVACLTAGRRSQQRRPWAEATLGFLLAAQTLLLPVNYAILSAGRVLPRVANFENQRAWLVWEGSEKTTLLIDRDPRVLIVVPRDTAARLEISGSDYVWREFFGKQEK